MTSSEPRMRILCCSTPMEGVFAPLLPLATALKRDGHEVLVATGPDLVGRVRSAGLRAEVAGPAAIEAATRAVADPVFAGGPQPWRIGAVMFARVMAPEKLPALEALADEFAPDLVLHAPVDLAAPILAAARGLPSVTYGTGLVLESELLSVLAGWVAPLWRAAGLQPDRHAGLYRNRYLNPVPASLQPDIGPAAAVSRSVRPAVPGSPDDLLPAWSGRLGARPIVYVSLGTVPIFNQPATFAPILDGLAREDVDLVVTVGHDNDPGAFGAMPANVHIERWLSLAATLPRCDAVVCHGGAGTTLAALACAIPLVIAPRGADQFATSSACQQAGAARVVSPDDLSADTVRAELRTVLSDPSYRRAALRLRADIVSMPPAARVARELIVERRQGAPQAAPAG